MLKIKKWRLVAVYQDRSYVNLPAAISLHKQLLKTPNQSKGIAPFKETGGGLAYFINRDAKSSRYICAVVFKAMLILNHAQIGNGTLSTVLSGLCYLHCDYCTDLIVEFY